MRRGALGRLKCGSCCPRIHNAWMLGSSLDLGKNPPISVEFHPNAYHCSITVQFTPPTPTQRNSTVLPSRGVSIGVNCALERRLHFLKCRKSASASYLAIIGTRSRRRRCCMVTGGWCFARSKTVTHPSTNRLRRRATSLICDRHPACLLTFHCCRDVKVSRPEWSRLSRV